MTHDANFFETAGTERDRGVAASNGNLALQGFKLWLG
jgi:hypothetical protein